MRTSTSNNQGRQLTTERLTKAQEAWLGIAVSTDKESSRPGMHPVLGEPADWAGPLSPPSRGERMLKKSCNCLWTCS